ncbi:MAG TPA: hypothetical protein VI895_11030 [Bdellovibrionota bacterium]|nr:hypothetical protein [Bdellovibrionota bacterium]
MKNRVTKITMIPCSRAFLALLASILLFPSFTRADDSKQTELKSVPIAILLDSLGPQSSTQRVKFEVGWRPQGI